MPELRGVHIAVISDVRDPLRHNRVRVRVPSVLGTGTSTWATPATYPVLPPKVGQKVWVQFIGGNIQKPVWWVNVTSKDDATTFPDLHVLGATTLDGTLFVGGATSFDDQTFFNGLAYHAVNAQFNGGIQVLTGLTEIQNLQALNIDVQDVEAHGDVNIDGTLSVPDAAILGFLGVTTGLQVIAGGITVNAGGINLDAGNWVKRGGLAHMNLAAGWGDFGGGYQAPSYVEYADHTAGIVGVASTGTVTSGTVIYTLPIGIRPGAHHVFNCIAGSGAGKYCQIAVESNGQVKIQSPTGTPFDWVAFGNIRWPMNGF